MTNDPSVMQTLEYRTIAYRIQEYNALVDHARFILQNSPDDSFTKLEITSTGHIRVAWPELCDGYYGGSAIETQSSVIEPTLFVKSRAEIEAVWAEEEAKQRKHENERRKQHFKKQELMDENRDRAEWERLKAKYGVE